MPGDSLAEYRRKRDFTRTNEPDAGAAAPPEGPLRFLVHKHAASRLHYDLRLELDGVLKCWAIPKGPSATSGERRFAAATEDHPLAYASFEGVIPPGQYGAGPSLIWDAGTFAPDEKIVPPFDNRQRAEHELRKGLAAGKIGITLRGKKLKGSWALVRMKEPTEWLLLKHADAAANPPAELIDDGLSVASGLDLHDLPVRVSRPVSSADWSFSPANIAGAKTAPLSPIEPMLAAATPIPRSGDWLFEPKLDGIRAIVSIDHGSVTVRTRNGMDITHAYPGVVAALRQQPVSTAVFDGELIAVTPAGEPSFELLQRRMNLQDATEVAAAERAIPTVLYLFDVMHLDGYDLCNALLSDRKEVLARVILPLPSVRETLVIPATGDDAYRIAVDAGFEGIMAKRASSRYEAGRRSGVWLKRKATDVADFVVCGFTAGTGNRASSFGGLIVGEWVDGQLEYRGRVGSGFTGRQVFELRKRLDTLQQPGSPFPATIPSEHTATWVRPDLVIEVEYANRTSANLLRAPVFKRLVSEGPGMARRALPGAGSLADRGLDEEARPISAPSPAVNSIIAQLQAAGTKTILRADSWQLPVTNLDKQLWPSSGSFRPHTKRDLLIYAASMHHAIDRHIRARPLTLLRYPNGIRGKKWYQKHWDAELPAFVETLTMYSDGEGGDQRFLLANNLPTLLWLCQLADIEWHTQLASITPGDDADHLPLTFTGSSHALDQSLLNYPDFILLDLDPYIYAGHERPGEEPQPSPESFERTSSVALALKEILDELGLASFVKTSGATGLHIFVPIQRQFDYAVIRAAANTLCAELLRRHPNEVTMEWDTRKRTGKVFLDANQNARHKNLAVAYSPRAKDGATVSMPLNWEQVGRARATDFTLETVPALVGANGDPWSDILGSRQDLQHLLGL